MFLGFPGFKVIAPSHWHDPGALLIRAIDDPDPVLFIENKSLYSQTLQTDPGERRHFACKSVGHPFPTLLLSIHEFQKTDLTLVAYGGLTALALEAARTAFVTGETCSEIIIPSALQPLDPIPILESVQRSGRLVILDEASPGYGFASEIAALVAETHLITKLKAPILRITAKNVPIGCAAGLESSILPSVPDVLLAMQKVLLGYVA
jgi:pyruvate dehydrogenase E1 component beta subunit